MSTRKIPNPTRLATMRAGTRAPGLAPSIAVIDVDEETIKVGDSTLAKVGDPPTAHATSHQNGGADEISVAGLSGELADPQPPKAHKSSHENGGADELNVAGLSGELSDPQPPKSHAHGNITNAGAIGSTADLPVKTGASGVLGAGAWGSAAGTFCQGNDPRLELIATSSTSNVGVSLSTSAADLMSHAVTPVAGDVFTLRLKGTLLNNSGNICAYQILPFLGSFSCTVYLAPGGIGSHASDECGVVMEVTFTVESSSNARLLMNNAGGQSVAAGSSGYTVEVRSYIGHNKTTSNLTGSSQTLKVQMQSNQAGTQTFTVHEWALWRRQT